MFSFINGIFQLKVFKMESHGATRPKYHMFTSICVDLFLTTNHHQQFENSNKTHQETLYEAWKFWSFYIQQDL